MRIPESVKLAVEDRVARLGDGVRDVLVQASVLGQEFDLPVLRGVTGLSDDELLDRLDAAVNARILADRSTPGAERFAFADDQVPQVLYTGLSGIRRRRHHLRAGQTIEGLHAGQLDGHVEELFRHFVEGNDPEKGADYCYRAGRKADRLYVWSRSIPFYQTALELWEELGGHVEQRAAVYQDLGEVSHQSAIDAPKAVAYLQHALALYEQAGDRRKRADIHVLLGREYQQGANVALRDVDKALEHLHLARTILEAEAESPALGLVYSTLALAYFRSAQMPESLAWARKATDVGQKEHSPMLVADACMALGFAQSHVGEHSQALETLEQGWHFSVQNNLASPAD